MRVLVLNASPKGEQSHTMAITRAFLSGFPEGTQTELLELRHLNIRPCTGCLGCWTKTPGRCVQRDDMDRVYAAIAAADVVVESFPLYFYGIPGTLKTLTDRCLPYTKAYGWSSRAVHELRDPAMLEKRLVLISTCWHTGIERLYAAVRTAYAEYAPGYQAIFCPQGELFAIDACRRQVSTYLADAAQAGREVAQTGRIADDTAARLAPFSNIVVFGTYATYVIMSIMMMVMIIMFLPAAQVSAQRINEVLETRNSLTQGARIDALETGTVEFRDVSFHYPSSDKNVLEHITFQAKRGETVAFIGATGSGKTTLVSLAARFYDATEGTVLVDGVDVRDYTFDALYDRIGYVTQKAILFSGDVRGNVLFGASRGKDSDADVQKALELAQASEFVDRMPGGIHAPIAEGGTNVSGGQKQRLSIARALARRPEILVFDDSFSALDYRTDTRLRAGLDRELKDTTRLIVAQRIGTIRNADKIIVLDEGRMVGMGTHEELMQTCPIYQEIARSQLSQEELGA